jgi:hypothetical protein
LWDFFIFIIIASTKSLVVIPTIAPIIEIIIVDEMAPQVGRKIMCLAWLAAPIAPPTLGKVSDVLQKKLYNLYDILFINLKGWARCNMNLGLWYSCQFDFE